MRAYGYVGYVFIGITLLWSPYFHVPFETGCWEKPPGV